ncbi:MAG: hypothetical protein ACK5WZ_13980 [Pseudobdellovibrionaceae bacterium]|jgi:hypothetical protein
MKFLMLGMITLFLILSGIKTFAQEKKVKVRKIQEVNFGEMSLKGTIRNPDGAYLVQKNGVKFLPLYEVQKNMDEKIRDAAGYVQ